MSSVAAATVTSYATGGATILPSGGDLGANASPDDIDFPSIMRLMCSKYTIDLVDRHAGAVRKLCKICHRGFLLKHLEPLVELLQLVIERFAQGQHELGIAICEFMRVASYPLVSCKASDMITYGHHLPDLVKTMVSVLEHTLPPNEGPLSEGGLGAGDEDSRRALERKRSTNERVRIEVAHTLACWSRFGLDEDRVELTPNQSLIQVVADAGTPNLRILRQSHVMDMLSASFRMEDSPEAVVITLGAIRDMSLYRPLARQISNSGLIANLVHVIRVNLLGSDVLLVAAEVLWNVMELDWHGAAEAMGQADIMESFRDFLAVVMARGHRAKDKTFRNDMMVLLMYASKRPENRPLFASTGLMALLCSHAVSEVQRKQMRAAGILDELFSATAASLGGAHQLGEDPNHPGASARVPLTSTQEDMEFRVLLWGTLARCSSSPECANVAAQCGLVPSLLTHLDAHEIPEEHRTWSQEQRRKVQLEALSSLFLLVQCVPASFLEARGNATTLQLLQATRSREVQRKCLHVLQVAVRMGPQFAEELGQIGCVGVLIELFADKDNPMSSRQLCASVLAGLCSGHADNCREFRKKDGVEAFREEVGYHPDETTDNHLFFTLCVVDCVWCAIVGTRKNEVRFIDSGGLFALLDTLEVAPLLLKRQIIGCLADLMQYRKAARLFVQWNSQVTMKGALKILLELWQNEQEEAGSHGPDGVIRDLDRPLNPQPASESPNAGGSSSSSSHASAGGETLRNSLASGRLRHARSFADLAASRAGSNAAKPQSAGGFATRGGTPPTAASAANGGSSMTGIGQDAGPVASPTSERQDCRAKIYAILACIGFECQEALTIAERQQLELVKLYPDSVQLEAWIAVRESLESRNVRPVSADRRWIEDSIAERKQQTTWVRGVQQELADERRNEEQASLHRFYEDIRSRAQFRRVKDGGSEIGGDDMVGSYARPSSFGATGGTAGGRTSGDESS